MPASNRKDQSKTTVLVVVAHRDDETLGMGGTIARHVSTGDRVFCLSMTDGVTARKNSSSKNIRLRQQRSEEAAAALGFSWIESDVFPDNAMDTVPLLKVTQAIERAKEKAMPTLVYTHSSADLNYDHRIVAQATLTAFRPQPKEKCHEIRTFEVPSATDYGHKSITGAFAPNLWISIEETWKKKLAALHIYAEEMRPSPHSRSFEGLEYLARYRGHQTGVAMAEAFEILRKIER